MAVSLELRLFGRFEAAAPSGRALDIASKKNRALLAYLALAPTGPVPRDRLVALLWSERDDEHARNSLRQALVALRRDLDGVETSPLVVADDVVALDPSRVRVDAVEFTRLAAGGGVQALREAMALYRGDLLDGLAINDPAFEEWVTREREHWRDLAIAALERLWTQETGEQRIAVAKRLLGLDPLREAAHRALMQAYAEQGNAALALRQYEACRDLLRRELDVAPGAETEELRRKILRNEVKPAAAFHPPQEVLALPDKPSIAVLPFTNMSGDPEREHFADGMTEDIITALSRIGELFVISRNSSFVYKGRAHRLESVARELGVRYILEGSVRAAGNRVRVMAQLIDGLTGSHVWAERYDGSLDDLFAVQDEITRNIALALQVKLTYGELARLWEGQTKDLRAWEKMVAARSLFLQFNIITNGEARRILEEALLIDGKYTGAMVQLGLTYWVDARFNLAADKKECLRLAEQQVARALDLDPDMGSAHMLSGLIAFLRDEHDVAIQLLQRAIRLAPSDSWVRACLALTYVYAGEPEKGLVEIKTAMRLSPHPPAWYVYALALVYLWSGDLPSALEAAEADLRLEPDDPVSYINLATVHGFQRCEDDAMRVISEARRKFPDYGMSNVLLSERYKHPENLHRVVDVLRKAGLPE